MIDNETVFVNHYLRSLLDYRDLPFLLEYFIVPSSYFRVWNRIALLAKGYRWKDCDEFDDYGCDLHTRRIFLQKYDLNHLHIEYIDKPTGMLLPTYSLRNKPVNEYLVISTTHDWLDDVSNSLASSISGAEEGSISNHEYEREVVFDCDSDNTDIDRNRSLSFESTAHSLHSPPQQRTLSQARPPSPFSTTSTIHAQRTQSGTTTGSIDNLIVATRSTRACSVVLRPEPIHSGIRKTYMTNTVNGMSVVAREENRVSDHNNSLGYSMLNAGNQRRKQGLGGD